MLFDTVADKLGIDESVVKFVWRHYWGEMRKYMSSPIEPEILIHNFGKLQLQLSMLRKQENSHRNILQKDYRDQLKALSLKLKHNNKKYGTINELSS